MTQTKWTKLARGKRCTIRLPGCDGGGETTVPAHYSSLRFGSGKGIKSSDFCIAYACYHCHSVVDGREFIHDHSRDKVRLAHAEGVIETMLDLIATGKVKAA